MAISVITRVWKHCQVGGNGLLLMLAIADHANEHGAAWPGFRLLQEKCKIRNRQTITRNLRQLEIKGELIIQPKQGPHGTNWYQVCSGMALEKVDAWRSEMGLPTRDALSLEDEIEEESQEVVQSLNHPDGEKVVTELNHSESDESVQSGYDGGSIPINGGSVGISSGVTAEPKPLLTVTPKPLINQRLTSEFNFRLFKRTVLEQLPKHSHLTTMFENCELFGVGELEDKFALVISTPNEKTAELFQSRLRAMTAQVAQGVSPGREWEVIYGWTEVL